MKNGGNYVDSLLMIVSCNFMSNTMNTISMCFISKLLVNCEFLCIYKKFKNAKVQKIHVIYKKYIKRQNLMKILFV